MEYKLKRKYDSIKNALQKLEGFINTPDFDWNYAFKLSDKFRAKLAEHKEAIKSEPELMVELLKMSNRVSSEFHYIFTGEERTELNKSIKQLGMVKAGYISSHDNYLQYFEYVLKEKEAEKLHALLQKNDEVGQTRKKLKI